MTQGGKQPWEPCQQLPTRPLLQRRSWQIGILVFMGALAPTAGLASQLATLPPFAIAQAQTEGLCPPPALSRIRTHRVSAGETLESLATDNNLIVPTLLVMNPGISKGALSPGTTLRIPPFNGIEVTVNPGQTWEAIATTYRVRADVLFEVNGCPPNIPERLFIPGIQWLLDAQGSANSPQTAAHPLTHYPLNQPGTLIAHFGWQTDPTANKLVFSSGVTLTAVADTKVLAAGTGTVAYVGEQADLGTLVVINHAQGLQTRYAHIRNPLVRVGEQVQAGDEIAIAAPIADTTTALYFEVRVNSELGWIAKDPGDYFPELAIR